MKLPLDKGAMFPSSGAPLLVDLERHEVSARCILSSNFMDPRALVACA
jgi:hypothetical protein